MYASDTFHVKLHRGNGFVIDQWRVTHGCAQGQIANYVASIKDLGSNLLQVPCQNCRAVGRNQ